MNLWVVNRQGKVSDMTKPIRYDINTDYITPDASEFELAPNDILDFKNGDFIYAKDPLGELKYFGLLNSFEDNRLIGHSLLKLLDFEIIATRISGQSFERHALGLINRYLINDVHKNMKILRIAVESDTPHTYQPSEPPSVVNLMSYLINGFKKYNVVWEFDRFHDGILYTRLISKKDRITVSDNNVGITNWEVSTTNVGSNTPNHVIIVDKAMKNMEVPVILSQWWLTDTNKIVNSTKDVSVVEPTDTVIAIYDKTEADKPTYAEVAEDHLAASYYSHEITVSIEQSNKLINVDDLYIGLFVNVYRYGRKYDSVITAIGTQSDDTTTEVTFGHIRSRFSELLK